MADSRPEEIHDRNVPLETVAFSRGPGGPGGERFVSSAQNFEDVILWRGLSDVEYGFYIDVGAGDPDVESVTQSFYERGWSGINIEPVEQTWRRICERRPRDINLQVGAGNRLESRPFFLVDEGGGLSTFSEDIANVHLAKGHTLDQASCKVVTLRRICQDHVARPVHFMKVDVEGTEREVLEGADFEHYRPWIVLVEATYPNSTLPTHVEWEGLLISANYRFAYFDGLNRFYVAEEQWVRLGAAFTHPPNVFDNFVRADEERAIARAVSAEREAAAAAERTRTAEQRVADAEREAAAAAERAENAERAVTAANAALECAQVERDAYEQEAFELNRHAAWVQQERQNLIWRIDDLQRDCENRITELQRDYENRITELQRDRDSIAQDLERHRRWVHDLYSSTSWKFARPVRAVRKLLNLIWARR